MKTWLSIFLICALVFPANSQSKSYFDSPYGFAGGFTPVWIIPGLSSVNAQLKGFGTPDLPTMGFFGTGGAGYIYLPFAPGIRVGGMGIGGSTKQTASVDGYQKEIIYHTNFGGLTAEYTMPFIRKVGVSAGIIIGAGSTSITLSRHKGNLSWNGDILSDNSADSYSRALNCSYFSITPTVNVEIPFYRLFAARVGMGYSLALGQSWKADNDVPVDNVPGDIKGGGLFISIGLFLGIFAF